jgi:hypothetical protein
MYQSMASPVMRKGNVPKQVVNLALRWMQGKITTLEVQKRFANEAGQPQSVNVTIYRMGVGLREAYRKGRLRITTTA